MGRPKQSLDILQPLDNTRHITLKSGAFGMVSRYGRVTRAIRRPHRMSPLCVEATDTAAACIAATQGAMSSAATAHIGLPSLTSTLTSTVVDDRWTSRVSSAKVHHQLVGYRILASRTIVMDHAAQPRPKNRHRSDLRGTGGPWVAGQMTPSLAPPSVPRPALGQSGGFIHERIDSRTRAQKSGLGIT